MTGPGCYICAAVTQDACAYCGIRACDDCLVKDARGYWVCPGCVWKYHEEEKTS